MGKPTEAPEEVTNSASIGAGFPQKPAKPGFGLLPPPFPLASPAVAAVGKCGAGQQGQRGCLRLQPPDFPRKRKFLHCWQKAAPFPDGRLAFPRMNCGGEARWVLARFSCPFRATNNGLPWPPPTPFSGLPGGRNPGPGRGGCEPTSWHGTCCAFPRLPKPRKTSANQAEGGCGRLGPGGWQMEWAAQGQWQSHGSSGHPPPIAKHDSSCTSCFPCASHQSGLRQLV